jgi:2-oxoisovalerate dehydrogenase E1 component alpha subunit
VDGNDVIAVRHVIQEAVEKARTGDGPTLIEAISYRLGDHTTADDATRYRDPMSFGNNGPWNQSRVSATT